MLVVCGLREEGGEEERRGGVGVEVDVRVRSICTISTYSVCTCTDVGTLVHSN